MRSTELFKQMLSLDNVLILTHKSPDADTLGSAAALKRVYENLGKKSYIVNPDIISDNLAFITGKQDMTAIPKKYDHIVSVDIATEELFGRFKDIFAGKVEYSIDHHLKGTNFARYNLVSVSSSSVGEYIAKLLTETKIGLDDYIASRLYCAISGDTGCFKYANVTSSTMRITARLLRYDVDTSEINRHLFEIASKETILLERDVLLNAERFKDDHVMVLTITKKMLRSSDNLNTDGIIALTRRMKETVIGISFKEIEKNEIKVSLRSLDKRIDVSSIATMFGGGGHKLAAGCTFKCDLKKAKEMLLKEIFALWDSVFGDKKYDHPLR